MAYVIPLIHQIQSIEPQVRRETGPIAVVLVPTKEVSEDERSASIEFSLSARSTNLRSVSKSSEFVRSNRLFAVGRRVEPKSREEKVKRKPQTRSFDVRFVSSDFVAV